MLSPDVLHHLEDSVKKYVQSEYGFEQRMATVISAEGYRRDHWQQFAELGWLGISYAEEFGGLGGTVEDTLGLMEQFGATLVVEPFLATVGLGGTALSQGHNDALKAELLPLMAGGHTLVALAYAEERSRGNHSFVSVKAIPDGDDFLIEGVKQAVLNAPQSTHLIVSARTAGNACDTHGITLFLIPTNAAGVRLNCYTTADGGRAANIEFSGVRIPRERCVTRIDEGFATLSAAIEAGILMTAAEAVGAMDALFTRTVEYAKARKQFGVPIASFQVLQHRLADMYIALERARAIYLRLKEGAVADHERQRALAILKVQVGKSARYVGQQAIQLHGGIAMTEELDVGHYFKRLTIIEQLFGNTEHHLRQLLPR